MLSKDEIRKAILNKRESLTSDEKEYLDNVIYEKVLNSSIYKKSKVVFIYVSFKKEVDTHRIIKDALKGGKIVAVPKVISKDKGMIAVNIKSINELKKGYFGVYEPVKIDKIIEPTLIDLVIMPGVAFDKYGGRIGYGGSFYDRFLKAASEKPYKLALAYKFQIIDRVPLMEHDILFDGIITA